MTITSQPIRGRRKEGELSANATGFEPALPERQSSVVGHYTTHPLEAITIQATGFEPAWSRTVEVGPTAFKRALWASFVRSVFSPPSLVVFCQFRHACLMMTLRERNTVVPIYLVRVTRLERAISKSLTSRINQFSYTQIQEFIVLLITADWVTATPTVWSLCRDGWI